MPSRAPLAPIAAVAVVLAVSVVSPGPAGAVIRRAFVTSVTGTGDLHSWADSGGLFALAAADNVCRVRAAAGGLPNAATYRAWMSTAATDAYCHVQGRTGKRANGCSGSPQPAGPWSRVTAGMVLVGGLEELTGPERVIYGGVEQDEFGEAYVATDATSYWTGTLPDGTVAPATCASWVVGQSGATGAVGDALSTAVEWTNRFAVDCSGARRLLCLEPGAADPAPAMLWDRAALGFVTSVSGNADLSSWPEAGGATGIEAGDAICRKLATDAKLPTPEAFVALLSDSSVDAIDRITLANVPIRRLDFHQVAASKTDLFDGTNSWSLHVDERGRYLVDTVRAYTGTRYDGIYDGFSCLDWTSTAGSSNVATGSPAAHDSGRWVDGIGIGCITGARLYCVANYQLLFFDGFDRSGDASRWSVVLP